MRLSFAIGLLSSVIVADAFVHPGVFLTRGQLDFVRLQVSLNLDPWKSAYASMLNSSLGSLDRTPTPFENVECGSYSNPNIGCTEERQDALASYAMSLAWYVSREKKYAQKAIEYFNAWSPVIKSHNNTNALLQTGWSAAGWSKAAEIIRHTYSGWNASDVAQFETMFKTVYVPTLYNGSNSNGNWELVMMEALQGIAVFLSNTTLYDHAMSKYLVRVPAYVYLETDGPLPKTVPSQNLNTVDKIAKYWQYQRTYKDGVSQETCRDFVHTGYGLASISHIAETARIQGWDLYLDGGGANHTTSWSLDGRGNSTDAQVGTRLRKALELHSGIESNATAVPSWLCNGTVNWGLGPVTEVGYDGLHTRLRYDLPLTGNLTKAQRPAGTNYLFLGWETLTHAGNLVFW